MVNFVVFIVFTLGWILIFLEQFLNIWNEKGRRYFIIYVALFIGLPIVCPAIFNFFEDSQNLWLGGIIQILAYSIYTAFFVYNRLYWYLRDRTIGLRPTVILGIILMIGSSLFYTPTP